LEVRERSYTMSSLSKKEIKEKKRKITKAPDEKRRRER